MARALAVLALAGLAHAFLPVQPRSSTRSRASTLSMVSMQGDDPKAFAAGLPGAIPPLGEFDPLGLSVGKPVGFVKKLQEAELKHGRVCMLAALGILVQEPFHPLFGGSVTGPAIFMWQKIPVPFISVPVLTIIANIELSSIAKVWESPSDTKGSRLANIKAGAIPGDLGFDPLGLAPADPAELCKMRAKELANGRLAMISVAGMVVQELVTRKTLF
eukprot:CAMPEP_0198427496 /NCGR_PEP_ID=MMETSP1452-20131203/5950_1 /TAXON_ID=1181717 /ORGANISM="Synchroma pusillum, Strain CCMP3072" /LENGTH=216 /DNA_ID=CAMNT_0044147873 /DNA_START=45 /DNA_END=695 /DNA_ORIENTATION=+